MPTMLDALDGIRQIERELKLKQRQVGRLFRAERISRLLTLEQVARKTRVSTATVYNVERGKSWKTKTARKIARFYDRLAA